MIGRDAHRSHQFERCTPRARSLRLRVRFSLFSVVVHPLRSVPSPYPSSLRFLSSSIFPSVLLSSSPSFTSFLPPPHPFPPALLSLSLFLSLPPTAPSCIAFRGQFNRSCAAGCAKWSCVPGDKWDTSFLDRARLSARERERQVYPRYTYICMCVRGIYAA